MAKNTSDFAEGIKNLAIGYIAAPTFFVLISLALKAVPVLSHDPFFYIFIPLSITILLMGIVSLIFHVNTFLCVLVLARSPSTLISYYINPGAQSNKVIRFCSIALITLGTIGLIISVLEIIFAFKYLF